MTEIHELISKRWSPVAFDSKPVEFEKIQLLFDAAKWAPSSNNNQPWRFIFATKDMPDYKVFLELMAERNRIWASTAPLFVMGLAQVVSTYKNRPNRLAFYEVGMAVSNLLLQATAMDLLVHQMSGYDHEKAKQVLAIPSRYEPASILAVGYKGDPSLLPEDMASQEEQERSRMQISDFLISGRCK